MTARHPADDARPPIRRVVTPDGRPHRHTATGPEAGLVTLLGVALNQLGGGRLVVTAAELADAERGVLSIAHDWHTGTVTVTWSPPP